jgi:hypothetical protein
MAQNNVLPLRQNAKPATRKVRRTSKTAVLRRHAPTVGLGGVFWSCSICPLTTSPAGSRSSPGPPCGKEPPWPSGWIF